MVITRTPFRISFFGGGTDYPAHYRRHGGAVLSTTIDKYCYITVRYLAPLFPYRYRIRYTLQEEASEIADIRHPSVRACLSFLNFHDERVEIQHNADLPAMTGLGSSSAFTVGLLNALYALSEKTVEKQALAREAIHIEQERLQENVGSQDQVAAAYGGLNKIAFGGKEEIVITPIVMREERLRAVERHCMLIFTGMSRIASDVAGEQIKNTPQKERELAEMHAMVDEGVNILGAENERLADFGKLLHEGWLLKRTLSTKITNSAIDEMYETARSAGAWGGKLLGAGGGGFLLIFASPEAQRGIRERLRNFHSTSVRFEREGSQVIYRLAQETPSLV